MTTTADEHLEKAREDVQSAISNLSKIVVEQCSGHDEYRSGFRLKLQNQLSSLLLVREDLNP